MAAPTERAEPAAEPAPERPAGPKPPLVRLGRQVSDGISPSILGLIERGIAREPQLVSRMRGKVVFRFEESFSPMRVTFRPRSVVVEDGDARKADLAITGRLPDIIHMATAPTLGGRLDGIPDPRDARGRQALGRIARGRVRVEGDKRLARKLLRLLAA